MATVEYPCYMKFEDFCFVLSLDNKRAKADEKVKYRTFSLVGVDHLKQYGVILQPTGNYMVFEHKTTFNAEGKLWKVSQMDKFFTVRLNDYLRFDGLSASYVTYLIE